MPVQSTLVINMAGFFFSSTREGSFGPAGNILQIREKVPRPMSKIHHLTFFRKDSNSNQYSTRTSIGSGFGLRIPSGLSHQGLTIPAGSHIRVSEFPAGSHIRVSELPAGSHTRVSEFPAGSPCPVILVVLKINKINLSFFPQLESKGSSVRIVSILI